MSVQLHSRRLRRSLGPHMLPSQVLVLGAPLSFLAGGTNDASVCDLLKAYVLTSRSTEGSLMAGGRNSIHLLILRIVKQILILETVAHDSTRSYIRDPLKRQSWIDFP